MPDTNAPILVATDLSARSDRAVDRAIALAGQMQCPVTVAHVVETKGRKETNRAAIEEQLRETLPDAGRDVRIALLEGSPPEALAQEAEAISARLIVAGVARYNEIRDYFLGTAIDHLVRKAAAPVLVIKQRARKAYRRIIVPVDLSNSSKPALKLAASLFPEAHITVLHAYDIGFEGSGTPDHVLDETRSQNEAELADFLASPELAGLREASVETRVVKGGTEACMAEAIDELRPDLVILGTQGSGGLRLLTTGSKANSMLSWIEVDTLVVRTGE
jgi:nucleotide-binding universal stress UspA family protein